MRTVERNEVYNTIEKWIVKMVLGRVDLSQVPTWKTQKILIWVERTDSSETRSVTVLLGELLEWLLMTDVPYKITESGFSRLLIEFSDPEAADAKSIILWTW